MPAAVKNWSTAFLWLILAAGIFSLPASDREKKQAGDADREINEPVYQIGAGITAPRVVHQVNPEYSPGSRGVRVVGTVTVALVVTSAGIPKDLKIVRGLDKDVDQTALDAVKQWRFDPARKDGKAVAVRITIEIQFRDM